MRRWGWQWLGPVLMALGLLVAISGSIWAATSTGRAPDDQTGQISVTVTPLPVTSMSKPSPDASADHRAANGTDVPPDVVGQGPAARPIDQTLTVTVRASPNAAPTADDARVLTTEQGGQAQPQAAGPQPPAGTPYVIVIPAPGGASGAAPLAVQLVTTTSGSAVALLGAYTTLVWVKRGKPEYAVPPSYAAATATAPSPSPSKQPPPPSAP